MENFMKIFKITTTILCAITLLMVSPSFGMGEKPNKDQKPKKVFGPQQLPAKKKPTEKDFKQAQKDRKSPHFQPSKMDPSLFMYCNDLTTLRGADEDINTPLKEIDSHLSLGANPNYRYANGEVPLHVAVRNLRAWQAVESLLNWKADPNALDNSNRTALHIATLRKNNIAVDLLLEAGAQTHIRDIAGRTPASYIIHRDRLTSLAYYKHGVVSQLLNANSTKKEQTESEALAAKIFSALNNYSPAQIEYQAEREQIANQIAEHLQYIAPLAVIVTDYISSDELLSTEDWSKTRAWPLVTCKPSPLPKKHDLDENKDDETEAEHQAAPTHQRDEDNPSSLKYIPRKSNNNDQ
jgi:hypothetical protein